MLPTLAFTPAEAGSLAGPSGALQRRVSPGPQLAWLFLSCPERVCGSELLLGSAASEGLMVGVCPAVTGRSLPR